MDSQGATAAVAEGSPTAHRGCLPGQWRGTLPSSLWTQQSSGTGTARGPCWHNRPREGKGVPGGKDRQDQ